MSDIAISCSISTTSAEANLKLTILLDQVSVFDQTITQPVDFYHTFSDDPAEHELTFILSNKQPEHTRIDEQGHIVEDACVVIDNIQLNNTRLGLIVPAQAVYTHDFNQTGPMTSEPFYGHMGCNGQVNLKFTTPAYLWILENN